MSRGTAAQKAPHYSVVVIGSGFGGTITALSLARAFARRGKGETIHILERGTWWTTPVSTVQDKEVQTYEFLQKERRQPVQFWPAVDHFRGLIDIILRCVRRRHNEDGLYDVTTFGKWNPLRLGFKNDGVSILRASGVGGGSLVYSNVTLQPPDLIFEDPRWPRWAPESRNAYFELARRAIGFGVLFALDERGAARNGSHPAPDPTLRVNTGLSNIVTNSARLDPHWKIRADPNNPRGIKQIDPDRKPIPGQPSPPDPKNALWINRARVFQENMRGLTQDLGTVDSSINDLPPEPAAYDPAKPANYCERQGRCNVGCLPGARHTLNKQLMVAIHGKPDGAPPLYRHLTLEPLAQAEIIRARPGGGYEIAYLQRDEAKPWKTTPKIITADRVILAGGCVGTTEIMLRCKARNTIPHLSDRVGYGFSTNGDYVAFLEGTKEFVSLTRGPVTTSFAHFNTPAAAMEGERPADLAVFHTIEDQGVPKALASTVGFGIPLIRSLAKGRHPKLFLLWALALWLVKRVPIAVRFFFQNSRTRQPEFQSEDEYTARMMCIAAMGREAAVGQFHLGAGRGETALRVRRTDGKQFHEDPIYDHIRASLSKFAAKLTDSGADFVNPFLTETADALATKAITLSHPMGGCIMGRDASSGVVDEYGRVFMQTSSHTASTQPGLYIADAAVIPTALGVNPSLTISALALRTADKIIEELP